jgi:hypothetical protein
MAVAQQPRRTVRFAPLAWGQPIEGLKWESERCIELPLAEGLMGLHHPGRVLDAGCACNAIMEVPPVAEVTHLTQNVKSEDQYQQTNRRYVSADLRDLSRFPDRHFDRIVCMSTLEHIGCDNSGYLAPKEDDPASVTRAIAELWRVCAGRLVISVPFKVTPWRHPKWHYVTDLEPFACLTNAPRLEVAYYRRDARACWSGPHVDPVDWVVDDSEQPHHVRQILCLLAHR